MYTPAVPVVALPCAEACGVLLRAAPRNCKLVCGDFLVPPLCAFHVVFTHNMVFTRALQRAMQLKMDRELPAGAGHATDPRTLRAAVADGGMLMHCAPVHMPPRAVLLPVC